jgi:hypothetical protein
VKSVDIDLAPERAPRMWSLERASIPLLIAVGWAGQLMFFGFWIGGLSTEVHTLTKTQEKNDAQVYQQKDATRDFLLMQSHIDALARRTELLEQDKRR